MKKSSQYILVAALLIVIPLLFIKGVRSQKGPFLDIPKARQKGSPDARVVIIEHADFQCEACAKIQPMLKRLLKKYRGKVRIGFKYHPLKETHKNAMKAAHAAECAGQQDRFWLYHDRLFSLQELWANRSDPTAALKRFARNLQLDMEAFDNCLEDPSQLVPIEMDLAEGEKLKIKSTPTFFIGKKRMVGQVFRSNGAREIENQLQ